MEAMNNSDITIERVIAEAELIRNREEKIRLQDELNAINENFQSLSALKADYNEIEENN